MSLIMILYYVITIYLIVMLAWNLVRENKSFDSMLHYLLVLVPLVLRILRVK